MNLGKELVTAIVFDGDLEPVLNAGLNLDWLNNPHGGWQALFVDPNDRLAFKLILEQYDKHGQIMTKERMSRHIPDYEWGEDESGLAELIDDSAKAIKTLLLKLAITSVSDGLEEGDTSAAAAAFNQWAEAINSTVTVNQRSILVLDSGDLEMLPDPETLIDGYVDRGYIISLYGRYSTAKSFLALDWACHIACGLEWQGHATKQGKVLYIAAEGGWGQKLRVKAWQRRYGHRIPKGSLTYIVQPMQLVQEDHIRFLKKLVQENEYDLVIIDTQARSTVGLDENSAQDMGRVIENCTQLRDAHSEGRTAVLLIHHAGKGGQDRGSSAVPAAADSQFKISRPGDASDDDPITDLTLTLSSIKRKDGPTPMPWPIKLEAEDPSLVLVQVEAMGTMSSDQGRAIQMFLSGSSVTEVMEKLGVSRATAFRYRSRYKEVYPDPEVRDERPSEERADDAMSRHARSQRHATRRRS